MANVLRGTPNEPAHNWRIRSRRLSCFSQKVDLEKRSKAEQFIQVEAASRLGLIQALPLRQPPALG